MPLQLGNWSHAVLACYCRQRYQSSLTQHAPRQLVLHSLQALTLPNCKADFGGQHYFATSPLSSMLASSMDSSWSPSNFLAPTLLGAINTHDSLSGMEAVPWLSASTLSLTLAAPITQAPICKTAGNSPSVTQAQGEGAQPAVSPQSKCFPTISVMGAPPTVRTEAMLMGVPCSPPTPYALTLTAKAKNQVSCSSSHFKLKSQAGLYTCDSHDQQACWLCVLP